MPSHHLTPRRSNCNRLLFFVLLFLTVLSACKRDEEVVPMPAPALSNFKFAKNNNPGLSSDVYLLLDKQKLSGNVSYNADISRLVASFDFVGATVRIGDQVQNSGTSVNDFSETVTYTVVGEDGSTTSYDVDVVWFTGLPVLYITTENGVPVSSKDDYVDGEASIKGGRWFEDVSGEMKIKGRGHSTWYLHPKKPYQLKFGDKTEVLGMPAEKKWILLAEHSDKTLMRNSLAFEMGYLSQLEWTPQYRYSEVFINGEYNGTYNITQKVEEGESRADVEPNGFLCEIDTPDHLEEEDVFFASSRFSTIQIKYPETSFGSPAYNEIKDHILEFENVLYAGNFTNPANGYRKYIDVASFVDWYLINEIAKNVDARSYSSIYFTYVPGGKIKMGPLWDFDLGFGNVDYADSRYPEGFWVKDHAWINRLFQDPAFVSDVKTRFAYFRSHQSDLLQFLDDEAAYLRWAQVENNNRWDVFGNYVWPNPVVYGSHYEEVEHLKEWFITRMNWLNDAYEGM